MLALLVTALCFFSSQKNPAAGVAAVFKRAPLWSGIFSFLVFFLLGTLSLSNQFGRRAWSELIDHVSLSRTILYGLRPRTSLFGFPTFPPFFRLATPKTKPPPPPRPVRAGTPSDFGRAPWFSAPFFSPVDPGGRTQPLFLRVFALRRCHRRGFFWFFPF